MGQEVLVMATVEKTLPELRMGDRLSRDEFMRRWEAMPSLKRAELVGGVVYMPSPTSNEHGVIERRLSGWLLLYQAHTPGCQGGNNCTWLMLGDSTQPDLDLYILPEYGGQSDQSGKYLAGAPEFLAEVCASSASYDLTQKLKLYEKAGVREYLAVLVYEREVRWHRLRGGRFRPHSPGSDGVFRSLVFPGLWLNASALLEGNMILVLDTLNAGLRSPEHAKFVKTLNDRVKRKKPPANGRKR
jgi:hypothetical protein